MAFDNSTGGLTGEYAQYNEIQIRRVVTREGQSSYFLNGTRCRRRDVMDIFLGTGLGPRSYAIIEQGMISRLIEAKPQDMRAFIEEAAGISKYRERRKETESRMRRTHENLDRLTDFRDELERQLNHLQKQARSAEVYKELQQNARMQRALLQGWHWQTANDQLVAIESELTQLQSSFDETALKRSTCDTSLEKTRAEQQSLQNNLSNAQNQFYQSGNEVSRLEQSIVHEQQRHQQLQADIEQIQEALAAANSQQTSDKEQLQTLEQRLTQQKTLSEACGERSEAKQAKLLGAEQAMKRWQDRWEAFNQ